MFEAFLDFLERFGAWGLFIHSFIDAVIFPIPAFFLQVSLSILHPSSALWLATVGFIACLLGTPVGYLIGRVLGNAFLYKIIKKEWIDAATKLFQEKGQTAILLGAFTPIPFKVFTIMSGCLNFPLWRLMAYAALGRATKFYVVGALFYFYGRAAEGMVKDVSLYIFIIAVPLILLFLYIKNSLAKRKKKQEERDLAAAQLAASETADKEANQLLEKEDDSNHNHQAQDDVAQQDKEKSQSINEEKNEEKEKVLSRQEH